LTAAGIEHGQVTRSAAFGVVILSVQDPTTSTSSSPLRF
jgi:hypothetical protein